MSTPDNREPLTLTGAMDRAPESAAGQIDALDRASSFAQQGRLRDAEQVCRDYLARFSSSAPVLNSLALLVQRRGALDESESLLRRAVEAAPKDAALRNNLANVLLNRGDIAGAEEGYRAAVKLNHGYVQAWFNLGVALSSLGREEEALAAYRRAAQLDPSYAPAHVQIGAILSGRGLLNDALQEFDATIVANPRLFDAHYYRGAVLAKLERFDDAVAAFDRAIALRPDRHEGHFGRGNALAALGRDEEALSSYGAAVKLSPGFLDAHYAATTLAWTMGRETKGLDTYAYARSRLGNTPDLLLAEGEFRIRFGEFEAAETLLRQAQAKSGERADIINTLARALAYQSRFDEAIALYEEAIRREPLKLNHRQDLGVALLRTRNPRDAANVLQDALKVDANDQTTLGYLTIAFREAGDSRAEEWFDLMRLVREFEIGIPVGFASVEAFNEALRGELEALHTSRMGPLFQTLHNGTQTLGDLFNRRTKAVQALHERISGAVTEYIKGLGDGAGHPFLSRRSERFSFSGSWSCKLHSNGFHNNHVHSKGWISSAYYVALPGAMKQSAGTEGWLKFGESNLLLGGSDRAARLVEPQVGKLVLFPSYFWHGTMPFVGDDSRLTVAFDVVPESAERRDDGKYNDGDSGMI
jgi:tetratricopeptide (TPR) repeat protein